MAKKPRKDYKVKTSPDNQPVSIEDYREPPWRQTWNGTTFDFRRWLYTGEPRLDEYGKGTNLASANRENLVKACRNAVWEIKKAEVTKENYCDKGLRYFFQYLDFHNAVVAEHNAEEERKSLAAVSVEKDYKLNLVPPVTEIEQIDKTLLESYIQWLRYTYVTDEGDNLGYTSCKSIFSKTKSVLNQLVLKKLLPEGIFPANPFPNSNRAANSHKPYPKPVFKALLRVLSKDIRGLRNGTLSLSGSQTLTIYLMVMAARSGRNPTPLLNATRAALLPHPIKPKQMGLLVTYKNRGNATSVQAFEYSDDEKQIEDMVSLPMDAVTIFHEVNTLTAPLAKDANPGEGDNLWLYQHKGSGKTTKGQVTKLTMQMYYKAAQSIVKRHNLMGEDGQPLKLNISRLRATFSQRMWQLTDGDHIKTARLNGNSEKVTDEHYLSLTPEMQTKHRNLLLLLHANFSGTAERQDARAKAKLESLSHEIGIPVNQLIAIINGDHNTGTGRCVDPKYGEYAPGNGTDYCTNWLNCFKCKDQMVLETDLYRLFSFYFLLLKERNFMKRDKWDSTYGWVIQVIDNEIIGPNTRSKANPKGCFDPLRVKRYRERAEQDPHPMWRDRAILQLGDEQ
ncbi:hypothetical protein RJ45_09600 [Photobacterium gaetbulicola]|uniref:Integrase n=1 Tax=Photobacterium gaetbulicola TaxID=1295392 RepID=A0A0B9GGF7_9GAMM|nr:hypothetical protein [Photobacterium gaetbulicola]KHT63850.1 hypothetical protein RJ45_09600 [Photobacterium gaetbulicola]